MSTDTMRFCLSDSIQDRVETPLQISGQYRNHSRNKRFWFLQTIASGQHDHNPNWKIPYISLMLDPLVDLFHDGLDAALKKINQFHPELAAFDGREMIDDFRLRGSRTCRGMDAPLRNEGWRTEVAHVVARPFNNPNALLSEDQALAVVV